jgi:hypothetical protein
LAPQATPYLRVVVSVDSLYILFYLTRITAALDVATARTSGSELLPINEFTSAIGHFDARVLVVGNHGGFYTPDTSTKFWYPSAAYVLPAKTLSKSISHAIKKQR